MDLVVGMAIAVLGVVFFLSLTLLITMCYRRYKFIHRDSMIKFSNLRNQEPIDDVIQLKPLIAQTLANDDDWTYDASGMVENCVRVLKLCQKLIDSLSAIPTQKLEPPVSFAIVQSANRIVPLFDDLSQAIAETPLDVRLMEARATAVITGCWALALPFSLINSKHRDHFDGILREMQTCVFALKDAVEQALTAANAPATTVVDEEENPNLPTVEKPVVTLTNAAAAVAVEDPFPADPQAPRA